MNGPYHSQQYNWETLVSNVAGINAYKLKINAQALVKWQRLVERHCPQQASAPVQAHNGQQNSHQAGSGSANRGSRGGGRGGPRGRGGGSFARGNNNNARPSRVNPRPTNAGPPAKVKRSVNKIISLFPSAVRKKNSVNKIISLFPSAVQKKKTNCAGI